jgi:hypothetical protein
LLLLVTASLYEAGAKLAGRLATILRLLDDTTASATFPNLTVGATLPGLKF